MKATSKILIAPVIALAFGCAQDSGESASVATDVLGPGEVAIVNGERIPESVFRLHTLNMLQTDAENLTDEGRAEIIEQLVFLELLSAEAESNGLDTERRIAAELELQRMQYLARAMTERFSEENPPTEAELRDLYQANLPRLSAPEYKTRHILVDTEAEANDLIEQLGQGADFADLAREHSTDEGSAVDGGDLGWVRSESVVEPFAEAIESATPGELLTTPIETRYGWHVILVEEMEEQVPPGLAAVREELIIAVRQQKLDQYAADLREAAEVTIVE